MGNSFTTGFFDKQKQMQKEMQQEMIKIQMDNMIRGQERMRRTMIATQMAAQREMLMWQGGVLAIMGTGILVSAVKKTLNPIALVPFTAISVFTGYTWHFAYGGKPNIINKHFEDIINDQQYWFIPVLPPPGFDQNNNSDLSKK